MEFPADAAPAPRPMTVKQLVYRLRDTVSIAVGTQWVEGELSNVKYHTSGHVYFTLKEQGAEIFCAFFKGAASQCPLRLQEGLKVHVLGTATVYPDRGQLQLVIKQVRAAGLGDLQARFLELKDKLQREGLFDSARKRTIPAFPRAIGIVTSPTGAVIQDMRHVLERRAPWVKAYLLPVRVQGAGAEREIAAAIQAWSHAPGNGLPPVDVVIAGRGGGSMEDLWSFNEEIVARAIASCSVPVISAVGHDTDFTIADFVADLRAPTPTAAAELATPDGPEWSRKLSRIEQSLQTGMQHALLRARLKLDVYLRGRLLDAESLLAPYAQKLDDMEETIQDAAASRIRQGLVMLDRLEHALQLRHPRHHNRERRQQLDRLQERLFHAARARMEGRTAALELLHTKLNAQSPEHTLQRGYSLIENKKHQLIRKTSQVHAGEKLKVRVSDGHFFVTGDID